MEELFVRFSHLIEAIFNGLDNKSLVKCKEVSEIWCDYISEEKLYLIRIIRSTVAGFHDVVKIGKMSLMKVLQIPSMSLDILLNSFIRKNII